MRGLAKAGLLGLAACASLVACGAPRPAYPRANIVVISVDTLRADHLGCYGYPRATSPNVDRLAREAIRFERAFAPRGHTWPSLTAMLTGLRPRTTNVRGPGELLAKETPTLASVLRGAGYETGAFLANFCNPGVKLFETGRCGSDTSVTQAAIDWLGGRGKEPFLLWLHLMAPHAPYQPPHAFDRFADPAYRGPVDGGQPLLQLSHPRGRPLEPADRERLLSLYDGEVLFSDFQIGRLLTELERSGRAAGTLVVFASDHGEDLGDHHDYFEHACSIYDSTLRIPLLLRLPDRRGRGTTRAAIVENIDLLPTLLELVGVRAPEHVEGRSLVPLLAPGGSEDEGTALAELFSWGQPAEILSLRNAHWRYVYNPKGVTPLCPPDGDRYPIAVEELYDQSADPGETRDLAAQLPDVAAGMRRELLERYGPLGPNPPPLRATDKETLEHLRALGYVN
jgi:arylsulfatase A-like enzyme